MSEKTELVSNFDWVMHEIEPFDCNEIDVTIQCRCGEEFNLYVPYAFWRCKKCGLVYSTKPQVFVSADPLSEDSSLIYHGLQ